MKNGLKRKGTTEARLGASWTTYLGAAYGVVTVAGMSDRTLEEVAGMTGMAFHLIMHKRCDPASVTVYNWPVRHLDALDRIGVLTEVYHYEPGMRTYDAARRRAVDHIRSAIDRGVGVIAWAIDTGEFGVIYGYDDEDGVFYVDGVDRFNRPFGSDPMLYENIGVKFPKAPFLHYQIPVAAASFDLEQTYRGSFRLYVEEMEKKFHMSPDFHSGFLAYDCWVHALEADDYDPFGLRYGTTVYTESKMFAAEYARRLAGEWGGLRRMDDIVGLFGQIAAEYGHMMAVLEQDFNGGQHLGKPVTRKQAQALIPHLQRAKRLEAEAVGLVKEG